eukprot:7028056-Ditylum_brightwellii.AAC.1
MLPHTTINPLVAHHMQQQLTLQQQLTTLVLILQVRPPAPSPPPPPTSPANPMTAINIAIIITAFQAPAALPNLSIPSLPNANHRQWYDLVLQCIQACPFHHPLYYAMTSTVTLDLVAVHPDVDISLAVKMSKALNSCSF